MRPDIQGWERWVRTQFNAVTTARQVYRHDAHLRIHALRQALKIIIDLTLSGLMLVVVIPLLLLIAAAVKLDGGPVFYAQPRVGRSGRLFRCYKFRSMRVNSDDLLLTLLQSDPSAAETWEVYRKLRNDPRVTPVGKFLRKTSLDELPQLFNVLRLDMSLVGPRPILEQEIHLYGAGVDTYYAFRPGLTGMWQVSGRSNTTFSERVRFDANYAESWSVWQDLRILARTVPVVFRGLGAR